MLEMMLGGNRGGPSPSADLVAGEGDSGIDYVGYDTGRFAGTFGSFDSTILALSFNTQCFVYGYGEVFWELTGATDSELFAYDLYVDDVYVPWPAPNQDWIYWPSAPDALKFVAGQTYKIELR